MNKKIIYFIIIMLASFNLSAQNSISIKSNILTDQLPSNSVHRVFQDKESFLWFGTLDGLCRYDGYRIMTFRSDFKNRDLLTNNEITCIAEDFKNQLWIGTKKGINILHKADYKIEPFGNTEIKGQDIKFIAATSDSCVWVGTSDCLYRYNSDFSLLKSYEDILPHASVSSIYEDRTGNVWVMLWRNGLFKYNAEKDTFDEFPPIGTANNPFRLYQDNKNNYWIGTWGNGLYHFNPDKKDKPYTPIRIINHDSKSQESRFFSIVQDDKYGYIWLMSSSGLQALKYNASDETTENIDISYLFTESNNIFSEIIKDSKGNLWVGTFSEGVYTIGFDQPLIKNYPIPSIKRQTGITTSITAIYEDKDRDIWINQNRWGLGIYNAEKDIIRFYQDYPSLKDIEDFNIVSCISGFRAEPDNIWVGAENEPMIYILRKVHNDIQVAEKINLNDFTNNSGNPQIFYEDRRNNIWIATTNGLLVKLYNEKSIKPIAFSLRNITDITEDNEGNIWISSNNSGIYKLPFAENRQIKESSIISYTTDNSKLGSNNTEAIHADRNGKIWIGTKEGAVIVYSPESGIFEDFTQVLNTIDGGIFNITSDDYGHIWISTNKRVIEFNPDNKAIKEYAGNYDDILVNSFIVNSYHKSRNGDILYGGNKGISVFSPSQKLATRVESPKTFITDVKINNRSLLAENNNKYLNLTTSNLTFNPDDKNIEIDFSSLDYPNAHKIRYAYKMEGIDDDWIYTGNNRQFAIYNQLKKGKYTFLVKAMDENGFWSEDVTRLNIYKRPAFYESGWAYIIYIILGILLIRLIYSIVRNRIRLTNDLKIAQIEKDKSEELTQTKLRYFTNISHDFLTPLTILSCLIDDAEMTYKNKITQFDSMRSNINKLRRLLQQVLDFRKIESGNMRLKISNGDIVTFIKDVCYGNFLPLMKKKNIQFSFSSDKSHLQAWFDTDKIDKIIYNLLSNAFKYTPENGRVSLNLEQKTIHESKYISIKIKDTGVGIAKEDLKKIFTRFYTDRTNEKGESNGIGLNLTKDLVEIHQGTIEVESEVNKGTLFTIHIPIDEKSYSSLYVEETERTGTLDETNIIPLHLSVSGSILENTVNKPEDRNIKTNILLVEDNEELLSLMRNILSKQYHILTATNGIEAITIVEKEEVHVIISDVMMPDMDGLELCRTLKNNIETSHIPIILLTARNSTEDRIECYKAGADGYISKPFDLEVLKARIDNFLSNRKAIQQDFQSTKDISISNLEYQSIDERFLTKAIEIIENYISESEFDVNTFANELCLSKSTLYRKVKAITGMAPVEFIRNIRLKHACQILKDSSISISEVAYSVGFSDPKYFTSCFKTEFNITPREFQKNNKVRT